MFIILFVLLAILALFVLNNMFNNLPIVSNIVDTVKGTYSLLPGFKKEEVEEPPEYAYSPINRIWVDIPSDIQNMRDASSYVHAQF